MNNDIATNNPDPIVTAFENLKAVWLSDPTTRVLSDEYTLTEDDINELQRVWTDDQNARFYKTRNAFCVNWYVSNHVLISVFANGAVQFLSGTKEKRRVQHERETPWKRYLFYLAVIRGLTTGAVNAPQYVQDAIEADGIRAFDVIDQHHPNGHVPFTEDMTRWEYEELNKEVQLLPKKFHDAMHGATTKRCSIDVECNTEERKKASDAKNATLAAALPPEQTDFCAVVEPFSRNETMYHDGKITFTERREAEFIEELPPEEPITWASTVSTLEGAKVVHKTETKQIQTRNTPLEELLDRWDRQNKD